jgi:predicted PhzF superfamily epimerase YddE/YHI9
VCTALGAREVKAACYARKDRNVLLHLGTESEVREIAPDFTHLRAARGNSSFLGVIVTAAGSGGYDFVSRYFAPWVGIGHRRLVCFGLECVSRVSSSYG